MNCTAWNSVDAKRAQEEPERHPKQRVRDREQHDPYHAAGGMQVEPPESDRARDSRLDRGEQGEREPVAEQ
jgi:hypothetical protein